MSKHTTQSEAAKAAIRRMRKAGIDVPKDFRVYDEKPVYGMTDGLGGIVVTGARFRTARRGPTAGTDSVKIPNTTVRIVVEG